MPKIRRGGFVFLAWKGDHGPRHVHVYRGGRLVVKWDLENGQEMKGRATRRVRSLIRELQVEGLL
jgi:cell wall-associated NlpC family hydrolase